jgi:RNA polymerase sigma factor (sigma-70 family)
VAPLLAKRLGTDRSFERLYRRHVGDVYRFSLAMLRNPADAEDVTQTTFLNAYRAYRGGERPHAAHRWLIAIAHNVCRQRFRQSLRRVEEVAYDETLAEAIVPDGDTPSAQDLRRALGHLAFNQRAALVMRELEGRSYAEIAGMLGVSASAVETLVFRARRALREQLDVQLSCADAELAVSRQIDGRLSRSERGALRAHLRACKECATLARKSRAQRSAIKALGLVPLPASLGSFFGGGATTAAVGGGVAMKAAAFVAASVVVAGAGHEAGVHSPFKGSEPEVAAPADATLGVANVASVRAGSEPTAATKTAGPAARRPVPVKPRPAKELPAPAAAKGQRLVPPGQAKRAQVAAQLAAGRTIPEPKRANAKAAATQPSRASDRAKTKRPVRPAPSRRPAKPVKPAKDSDAKKTPGPAGGTAPGGDEGTSSP